MDRLFVYGTLKQGHRLHHLLERPDISFLGPARIRGRLYNLGAYPGWVPCSEDAFVQGELYGLTFPKSILDRLDRIEGFRAGNPGSPFVRERVRVYPVQGLEDLEMEAWAYRYNRPLDSSRRIESGIF